MFVLERWARQLKRSRIRSKGLPAGAELLTTTSRTRCRFGLLAKRPLVPQDPASMRRPHRPGEKMLRVIQLHERRRFIGPQVQ